MSEASQIKNFFNNQTVFLTGGSTLLGKILIEKLLRECEELKKIYVLAPPNWNKAPKKRFEEFFDFACFGRLKAENADLLEKVSLMNGDCQERRLGLSGEDVKLVAKETTCVIHAAENVQPDQSLREAVHSVRGTRDLLEMAKKMANLKVFVYVSTAYSNYLNSHIKEDFYEPPLEAEKIIAVVDILEDEIVESITPKILQNWPNTYIYSKSITEDMIRKAGKDLPITVLRPAIVSSSASEPMPGWIDNRYGVIRILVGATLGIIRSLHGNPDAIANIVPVDHVANCLLASAWKRTSSSTTTIYNFVGHKKTLLTWSKENRQLFDHLVNICFFAVQFMALLVPYSWAADSQRALRCFCMTITEDKLWHQICVFFLYTLPAHVVDFVLYCTRRPPITVVRCQDLNKNLSFVSHFSTRSWTFDDDNVRRLWNDMQEADQKLFFFNSEMLNWDRYGHDIVMGMWLYILKETPDTFENGKRQLRIFIVVYHTVVALCWCFPFAFVLLIWSMFM